MTSHPQHSYERLSGLKRDMLLIISGGPILGRQLKDDLESRYPDHIQHGRYYTALGELVDDGLVTKEPVGPRDARYSLTADAHKLLSDRADWESQYR